jgi:Flp pilus assembly pilin Flp
MRKFLRKLWTEEKAENMPEYALLLFLISLTAVSAMTGVASRVNSICSTASIHMTVASNRALVGGAMGYTVETPANPESKPKQNNKPESSH